LTNHAIVKIRRRRKNALRNFLEESNVSELTSASGKEKDFGRIGKSGRGVVRHKKLEGNASAGPDPCRKPDKI